MSTYQKVLIVGRLGRDPETRYTQSGTQVVNISLATSEKYTDNNGQQQEKTEWHKVMAFGKTAENSAKYLSKGRLALVEGQLQTDKYTDKEGVERYITKIKAHRVVFMGGGQDQGQGPPAGGQDYTQQHSQPPWQQGQQQSGPVFLTNADTIDDAPF